MQDPDETRRWALAASERREGPTAAAVYVGDQVRELVSVAGAQALSGPRERRRLVAQLVAGMIGVALAAGAVVNDVGDSVPGWLFVVGALVCALIAGAIGEDDGR